MTTVTNVLIFFVPTTKATVSIESHVNMAWKPAIVQLIYDLLMFDRYRQ